MPDAAEPLAEPEPRRGAEPRGAAVAGPSVRP